jgi:putative flippase GtrA
MFQRIILFIGNKWHISMQILKFLFSGGTVALVELIFLYLFTNIFGIWYILSLILAFLISFVVSFAMQKFWTFDDKRTHQMHIQASSYMFVALANLGVNAVLLYLLVQFAGMWYIYAQIVCDAIIACESFLIYKFIIFK